MSEETEEPRRDTGELEPLTSRVPADLAEYVRQRAKKQKRTISAEIAKILEDERERERRAS